MLKNNGFFIPFCALSEAKGMVIKMKKIALVIIALLVCLAGATASTASPIAGSGEIIDAPDGYTKLVIESVTTDIEDAVAQCVIEFECKLVAVKDIYITNENGDRLAGEATISINIADLKSTDKVTLVHLKDDGTCEIVEGVIVEDGKVTFTSEFSYFGFCVQSTTATSPKTADVNITLILLIALSAISLILISVKKLRTN